MVYFYVTLLKSIATPENIHSAIYGPATAPTRLKLVSLCNIFMVFVLTLKNNDGPDQTCAFAHG